jgi:hypothetical protein
MIDEAGSIENGVEISEQTVPGAETVEQPVNSNEDAAIVASAAVMDDEKVSYRMDEGGVRVPEDEAGRLAETTLAV